MKVNDDVEMVYTVETDVNEKMTEIQDNRKNKFVWDFIPDGPIPDELKPTIPKPYLLGTNYYAIKV